jgi:hypothetical protein
VASKILPHGLHLRLANRLRGLGEGAGDPYPTVCRQHPCPYRQVGGGGRVHDIRTQDNRERAIVRENECGVVLSHDGLREAGKQLARVRRDAREHIGSASQERITPNHPSPRRGTGWRHRQSCPGT